MNVQEHLDKAEVSRSFAGNALILVVSLLLSSCSPFAIQDRAPVGLVNAGAETPDSEKKAGRKPAGEQKESASESELQKKLSLEEQVRRERARDHLREGKRLKEELNYAAAEEHLEKAVRLDPKLTEAQQELDSVRILLGKLKGAGRETLRRLARMEKLQREQVQAQIKRSYNEAEVHMAKGEYGLALEKYEKVAQLDDLLPYSLNLPELVQKARKRAEQARKLQEQKELEERRETEEELRAREEYREKHDLEYLQNKIKQLNTRAEDAYRNGRFNKAERFASQALALDPSNPKAQKIARKAKKLRHLHTKAEIERETARNWDLVFRQVHQASVPYQKIFKYPPRKEWEKLGKERVTLAQKVTAEEPLQNKKIRRTLETTRITRISFDNRPLKEVLEFLRKSSGISFVCNKEAREAMALDELTVNLAEVRDLPLKNVLRLILESVGPTGYGYQIRNGAVVIGPKDKLRGKKYLKFYSVGSIVSSHPDYPAPPMSVELKGEEEGGMGGGGMGGGGGGLGGGLELEGFGGEEETEGAGVGPQELIDLINSRIFEDKTTLGTVSFQSGKLAVRTTLELHRKIRELLESLRKLSGVLVSVEARFLDMQDNLLEDIGVHIGDTVESALETPIPDIDGLGTSVASGYSFLDQGMRYETRAANITTYSGVLGTEVTPFNITPRGGMALQWNLLEDYQLEAILTAVSKSQKSRNLDAPRVIAFDRQTAHTMVIDQNAYIKDVDVNQTGVSPVINPLVGSFRVGSLLEITPTVTHDRKYVILEVKPTTANHIDSKYADLSLAQGYTMVQVELPVIRVAQLQTTITIPDRGTVLLGGLKKVIEQQRSIGIPILQRIPVLNLIFGRRGQTRLRNNLSVLITSRIVITKEEEKANFP